MLGDLDVVGRPRHQVGNTKVAVNGQGVSVGIVINLTPAGEQELVVTAQRAERKQG